MSAASSPAWRKSLSLSLRSRLHPDNRQRKKSPHHSQGCSLLFIITLCMTHSHSLCPLVIDLDVNSVKDRHQKKDMSLAPGSKYINIDEGNIWVWGVGGVRYSPSRPCLTGTWISCCSLIQMQELKIRVNTCVLRQTSMVTTAFKGSVYFWLGTGRHPFRKKYLGGFRFYSNRRAFKSFSFFACDCGQSYKVDSFPGCPFPKTSFPI